MVRLRPASPSLALSVLLLALAAGPLAAQPDERRPEVFSDGRPPIVGTLGEDRFVRLTAVNQPGRVVWFNHELAREMGIELPASGRMTPELEAELSRHLSWRLLKEGEAAGGRPTVDMWADRYGGWGMGYNKGAGRAAFFGRWNLNIKGVGATPLVSSATHESHRHGGAPLKEGILEAVWGEVGTNLFQSGSTRILAVLDVGDHTTWGDGGKERRALIVRAGDQLRPAHLYAEGFSRAQNFETLERMLEASGNLVHTAGPGGREVIDLDASLQRLTESHARTAAELYRNRILHGGLSPGNKSFDGGMLDLGTITSQPRTAPVHVLDYTDHTGGVRPDLRFESENEWRVRDLETFQRIALEAAGRDGYRVGSFQPRAAYDAAYAESIELQLLEATGLKPDAARALRRAEPALVREYATTIRELGALTNPVEMNIERSTVERGSVVDVFGALRELPAEHFGGRATPERVLELLQPTADDPARLERAREGATRLAELHGRVLDGAWSHSSELYDGRAGYARSVVSRARFENQPLDLLQRARLQPRLVEMIAEYERTGDPEALRAEVDRLVAESRRDVDRLLESGRTTELGEGGLLSSGRSIEGVDYSVRSAPDGGRFLRVELPLEAVEGGLRPATVDGPVLHEGAARDVHYRYTTDGWRSYGEVRGEVVEEGGRRVLRFEVPAESGAAGRLEGVFHARGLGDTWIKAPHGRNFTGWSFAVPDAAETERLRTRHREGRGFGPRRRVAGPARPLAWSSGDLDGTFRAMRDAARERVRGRLDASPADLTASQRRGLTEALERMESVSFEVERSGDIDARYLPERNLVRVSEGLLGAIDRKAAELPEAERADFRRRALGLVVGHELAHGYGIASERVADAEGVRLVERARVAATPTTAADARRVLEAFRSEGSLSLLERARAFATYGTESSRAENVARAARGEPDPLARYRRADGTVEWSRLTRDRALREAGGLAHFGLALFLKELAVVARTGDRARIEEFFDGLMTTDFYKHYGMFVLGARAGEVAYSRYLERFVKPRFVNSILKTNLVLAAGIALPQLAEGTFNGRAFAISLTSLGLSSAAVRTGVSGIRWVYDLSKARRAGALGRLGLGASRFARIGGWFYTAAELAVVLYVADEIDQRVNGWLDERAARDAVRAASEELLRATRDPTASVDAVREAAERYHAAWTDYRNFLYRPLQQDEVVFAGRMERAARKAKLAADEREAALARIRTQPALLRDVERRYGSLEAYAAHLTAGADAEVERDVRTYAESYQRARDEHLREVYEAHRRQGGYLAGVDHLDWALAGGRAGAPGDPYAGRSDFLANLGRDRARDALGSALGAPSGNRLQSYDDERELLDALARGLARGGRRDQAEALREVSTLVARTQTLDERLYRGDGTLDASGLPVASPPSVAPEDPSRTRGVTGALDGR